LGTTVAHCISPFGGYRRGGGCGATSSLFLCGGGGVFCGGGGGGSATLPPAREGVRPVGTGGRGLTGTFVTGLCDVGPGPSCVWAATTGAGPVSNIRAAMTTARVPSRVGFMCPASAPDGCGRECTISSIQTRRRMFENPRRLFDLKSVWAIQMARRYPIG
jgi:hypothetical protein